MRVPESELRITFVRSRGPGGQNVNKTSSKAQLHWHVQHSSIFSDKEKARIAHRLAPRMNKLGYVVLASEQTRSQMQNRERVIERLHHLIERALEPEVERIPTRPTRASKKRRLREKVHHGLKKALRQKPSELV